jgi:hypothetical protein
MKLIKSLHDIPRVRHGVAAVCFVREIATSGSGGTSMGIALAEFPQLSGGVGELPRPVGHKVLASLLLTGPN